ncbi:hypothetical protein HDU84_009466 [Entophlyctis sp. JEL0112]|nr:hypothetical protein HDU84_009466 [Entophlyctis sp. JEL0112]
MDEDTAAPMHLWMGESPPARAAFADARASPSDDTAAAGAVASAGGVIVATPDEGDAFPPAFTHPHLHRPSMLPPGPSNSRSSLGRDIRRQTGANHKHSPSLSSSELQRSGSAASASSGNPYYSKGYALAETPAPASNSTSTRAGGSSNPTVGRSQSVVSNWFTDSFTFGPVAPSPELDDVAFEQLVDVARTVAPAVPPRNESALTNGLAAERVGPTTADAIAPTAVPRPPTSHTINGERQIEDDTFYSSATSSAFQATLNVSNVMLGSDMELKETFGRICGLAMLVIFAWTAQFTAKIIAQCMLVPFAEADVSSTALNEQTPLLNNNPHRHRGSGTSPPPSTGPNRLSRSFHHHHHSTIPELQYPTSLSDIAEVAFGRSARNLVTVLFSLELFTAATGLLILASDSIHSLEPTWDPLLVKIVVSCVLVATTLPRGFAFLAWGSVFGVATLVALFGVLVGTGLATPPPGPGTVWVPAETSVWPPAGFEIWPAPPAHGGHTGAPSMWLAAGLIVVGLDAHAIYPGIYCDLKEKRHFGRVVGTAYLANWSLYTVFAGVGYIMFGKEIMPQVTQNFALIPGFNPDIAKFILIITALNPFTKFALIMAPVILRIEQIIGIPLAPSTSAFVSPSAALLRILLGLLAVLTTIQFPSFHTLMGLVGSVFSFVLAGVVPCLCFLRLSAVGAIPFQPAETAVCVFVVLGAAALAVVGTAAGVYS